MFLNKYSYILLATFITFSANGFAETSQLLACTIDNVAGIDSNGVGKKLPAKGRFTARWFKAQINKDSIEPSYFESDFGDDLKLKYTTSPLSRKIWKNRDFLWEHDINSAKNQGVRGIYVSSFGDLFWIAGEGSDNKMNGLFLKKNERLGFTHTTIRTATRGGYIQTGYCEPF